MTSKGLIYKKHSINWMNKLVIAWSICIGNYDFSSLNIKRGIPKAEWKTHEMLRSWHHTWDMFWAQQLSGGHPNLKGSMKGLNNCSKTLLEVTVTYYMQRRHCFWPLPRTLGRTGWEKNQMTDLYSALQFMNSFHRLFHLKLIKHCEVGTDFYSRFRDTKSEGQRR